MARPSFVKPSVLVLTLLCLSQLLAATEAPANGDATYHAKVKVVNKSKKDIQQSSIYITHKFRDISVKQLKFPKGLLGTGQSDEGNGDQIVDYASDGTNNKWFVTWVFKDSKSIQISKPSNFDCLNIQINEIGAEMVGEVEYKEPGALSCGLPPTCDHPPANAAEGAAVATDFISRQLTRSKNLCAFQMFELTDKDSIGKSADNWVTITIQPDGVLLFESATKSAKIGYGQAKVDVDGIVSLDSSDFPTPRAAGSFGVEIPAIISVA